MALTNKTGRKHLHLWAWSESRLVWFCEKCDQIDPCDHKFKRKKQTFYYHICDNCEGEYLESETLQSYITLEEAEIAGAKT